MQVCQAMGRTGELDSSSVSDFLANGNGSISGFSLFAREFLTKQQPNDGENKVRLLWEACIALSDSEKRQFNERARELKRQNRLSAYQCFLIAERKQRGEAFREEKSLEKWCALEPLRKKKWQQVAEEQSTLKRKRLTGYHVFTREFFAENTGSFSQIQALNSAKWKSLSDAEKQVYNERAILAPVEQRIVLPRRVSGWNLFRIARQGSGLPFAQLVEEWRQNEQVRLEFNQRAKEANRPKDDLVKQSKFKVYRKVMLLREHERLRQCMPPELTTGVARQAYVKNAIALLMGRIKSDFDKMSEEEKEIFVREYEFKLKLKERASRGGFQY